MNLHKLKKIYYKFPFLAGAGYTVLKKIWHLQASYTEYEYPEDTSKATVSPNTVLEYNQNRLYGPKKRICYAVYNNLHFNMNGDVFSCSFNADMHLGNINKNSIMEIWNGRAVHGFRKVMSDYNMDKCLSCKEVLHAKNYSSFPGLKYDMFSSETTEMPTQMSFEMSDLCNFACIMCSEEFSSAIKKKKNISLQKNQFTDAFIDQLDEFIPHLKIATFIGGEPLMIKSYFKIWEKIVALNPECQIHIQTNGSILNERFLHLLELGNFEIGVSIDSLKKDIFEKIRLNADFDVVMENINTLLAYHQKGKITLNFNFCPLTENWMEIPQMVDFANKCGVSLKIIHVLSPYNLAIINRKPAYLKMVFDYLDTSVINNPSTIVSKVNRKVFDDFKTNVRFYYQESIKREEYINDIAQLLLEDVVGKLSGEVAVHVRFKTFSDVAKKELLKKTFILFYKESDVVQKRVMAHMLYLLKNTYISDVFNGDQSLITKPEKFLKVISELILLEKGL